MVIVLKENAEPSEIKETLCEIKGKNVPMRFASDGKNKTVVLTDDISKSDSERLLASGLAEEIKIISEPYKLVNRKFHTEDTVVSFESTSVGAKELTVISGPCSVENEEQIISAAKAVKKAGATMLRGGAYKPRTSPYDFQGLGKQALRLLKAAGKEVGLPVVCELTSLKYLEYYDDIDMIQIGARNMKNYEMLKEVGRCKTPVLLKRGNSSTLEEWLMSAEYIMLEGNCNVVLCERGIRTFETTTRNTFDVSAIPILKQKTHLPILADPSHASGIPSLIGPLSAAAVAAGADGLMIEVHPTPERALSDSEQALTPKAFSDVMRHIAPIAELCGKTTRTSFFAE